MTAPSLKERARLLARDFGAKWAGLGDDAIKDLTALLQSVHDEAIEKAAQWHDYRADEWQAAYECPDGEVEHWEQSQEHRKTAAYFRRLKSTPSITERG